MIVELRLILLGLGVALVAGLWWWERRRNAEPAGDDAVREPVLMEPRLAPEPRNAPPVSPPPAPEPPMLAEIASDTLELPARRAPVLDRPVPQGDPPVVTIDGLPEETIEIALEEPAPKAAVADAPERFVRHQRSGADRRRPVPDPPIIDPARGAADEAGSVTAETDAAEALTAETPPRHQRIVAVRILSRDGRRIEGKELVAALGREGLEFGRYSIFHRNLDGGRSLYSVASLVEPGSFDPSSMESSRFPGVSMFAVFPGPLPAPQCFDELLASAQRLAERLGATLQDDNGSSLTGQRVHSIREDLVHFEHLVSLSRSRPRA